MKLKWQELSTEQKQIILLAVLLAFGASLALYRFVLVPSLEAIKRARTELGEVENQLQTARRLIANRDQITAQLEESARQLEEWAKDFIAPKENALAWATEYIYQQARKIGIDIESASEVAAGLVPWKSAPETARIFDPYVIRVVFRTDFFHLVDFLEAIEQSNPFVIVGQVSIAANRSDYSRHNIEVRLWFPTWAEGHSEEDIRRPPKELLEKTDVVPEPPKKA